MKLVVVVHANMYGRTYVYTDLCVTNCTLVPVTGHVMCM